MYKAFLFVCFYCLFSFFALARGLDFVANQGQWDNILRYKADISGGTFYLTDEGFRFYLYQMPNEAPLSQATNESFPQSAEGSPATDSLMIQGHYYKVNFLKAAAQTEYVEENASSSYHNYFLGNDHTKWRSKVPLYGSITRKNIYPGIDLKVHSNEDGNFKYDFVIAPHADHSQIKLEYEGIVPQLTAEGHLLLPTACGDMQELAPYSYQNIGGKKENVKSRYVLEENVLRFEVSAYNPEYPLVIDPEVTAATYVPISQHPPIVSHDLDGNIYTVTPTSWMPGIEITPGAFQPMPADTVLFLTDLLVSKYSKNAGELIYATFYGGINSEYPLSVQINNLNQLVVAGLTHSVDLPVTSGAFATTINVDNSTPATISTPSDFFSPYSVTMGHN